MDEQEERCIRACELANTIEWLANEINHRWIEDMAGDGIEIDASYSRDCLMWTFYLNRRRMFQSASTEKFASYLQGLNDAMEFIEEKQKEVEG